MQGRIEVPLSKLLRRPTEIVGAGRTDTDINVLYYVAHLYTTKEIDCDHIAYKLNAILPHEAMILATYPAPVAILNRKGYSSRTLNIVRMQNRRCGARAEGKLVCTMPSREEEKPSKRG